MMPDIEICLRRERQLWAALLEHDDGTPDFFEDLARKTVPVVPHHVPFWPRWNADSAFTPSCTIGEKYYSLPPWLAHLWREYRERWQRMFHADGPDVVFEWRLDDA